MEVFRERAAEPVGQQGLAASGATVVRGLFHRHHSFVCSWAASLLPRALVFGVDVNIFFKILICLVAYFVTFIGNSIYHDLNNLQPSPALGTQLGFISMIIIWLLLPKK